MDETSMKQPSDFMRQPLEKLKEIISNYKVFCRIAEELEWLDVEEQHDGTFRSYDMGIEFEVYKFPENYIILHHVEDVYARTVLASMAWHEEWEPEFWDDTSQAERKRCLTEGKWLYENYAAIPELRLIERDWDYLVKEIRFWSGETKVPAADQKRYLNQFDNAKVIELGGYYAADYTYWAIKRNILLVVSCGCWD